MKYKAHISNLLRGSPVALEVKSITAKVNGKPAVLSRNGENMSFLNNSELLSELYGETFKCNVCYDRQEERQYPWINLGHLTSQM